jgi:hypothetical protein
MCDFVTFHSVGHWSTKSAWQIEFPLVRTNLFVLLFLLKVAGVLVIMTKNVLLLELGSPKWLNCLIFCVIKITTMNWTTFFWDNVITLSLKTLIMYYAWNVLRILPPRTRKWLRNTLYFGWSISIKYCDNHIRLVNMVRIKCFLRGIVLQWPTIIMNGSHMLRGHLFLNLTNTRV